MARSGGTVIEQAEAVVDDDRQLLSFACTVRPEVTMESLIPAALRCPRADWEQHPSWATFMSAGGFNGWPLTAHRAFRRRSQEVIELVLHIQLLLPRLAGKHPPTMRLRMGTAAEHWKQWMSAMQGGHARFEERRLFKYIQARWGVDIGHLPQEHRELERCELAVAGAMAAAAELSTPEKMGDGGAEDLPGVAAMDYSIRALLKALLDLDACTIRHLGEEEELVIPLLLDMCSRPSETLRWQTQNALRGLCTCKKWFCPHRTRELGLITPGEAEVQIAALAAEDVRRPPAKQNEQQRAPGLAALDPEEHIGTGTGDDS
jgi:hypothetical protein